MAKLLNNTSSSVNADTSWKAQAFINLYVKRADGSRAKVGAIPLRDSKRFEAALVARLQEEGGVEAFVKALEVDFQMAESSTPVNIGF